MNVIHRDSIKNYREDQTRDAKISLVEEHSSNDEQIQQLIREKYSLSQELSLLRKEVATLTDMLKQLMEVDLLDSDSENDVKTDFNEYTEYVEQCIAEVEESPTEVNGDNE